MATTVDVFTLDLNTVGGGPNVNRLPANVSFESITNNVQTLWANSETGDDIEGLFYVPDLPPESEFCNSASGFTIPSNVTRRSDFPPANYPIIALAPWQNSQCVIAFLEAAQSIATAFVFFLPDNGTTTPPPLSAPVWNINQQGPWNSLNNFPIYAVPGQFGAVLMQQLATYSGNISSLPDANALDFLYGPDDYIRIYADFSMAYTSSSHYPTLWAFLLIILGVVLFLLAVVSLTMRWRQRRNRNALRQRILAGQVDLELLGIKSPPRMSQNDVDALQVVKFVPADEKPTLPLPESSSQAAPPPAASPKDYNQTTCPICLEDYVANETTVRVLPCHHIYHPECIDPHLLASSSLCPVCKARVPTVAEATRANGNGQERITVPRITNAMVRRERYIRQARERAVREHNVLSPAEWFQRYLGRPLMPTVGVRVSNRRQQRTRNGDRTTRSVGITSPDPGQLEMGPVVAMDPTSVPLPPSRTPSPPPVDPPSPSQSQSHVDAQPQVNTQSHINTPSQVNAQSQHQSRTQIPPRPPQNTDAHREWARRRASTLMHRHSRANSQLGNADAAIAEIAGRRAERPRWRRGIDAVFPGFH